MTSITISVDVDDEAAREFAALDDQRRRKLGILLGWRLRELLKPPQRTLLQIMDDMGRQAQANGLTPEILQSILDDDSDDE